MSSFLFNVDSLNLLRTYSYPSDERPWFNSQKPIHKLFMNPWIASCENSFAFVLILMIRSGQRFEYVKPIELSLHVQNYDRSGHIIFTLKWRHNERDGVSKHQPHDCFLNRLFRRRSKKTSKLCVTGLCAGNSPVTGEFPAQKGQ